MWKVAIGFTTKVTKNTKVGCEKKIGFTTKATKNTKVGYGKRNRVLHKGREEHKGGLCTVVYVSPKDSTQKF